MPARSRSVWPAVHSAEAEGRIKTGGHSTASTVIREPFQSHRRHAADPGAKSRTEELCKRRCQADGEELRAQGRMDKGGCEESKDIRRHQRAARLPRSSRAC